MSFRHRTPFCCIQSNLITSTTVSDSSKQELKSWGSPLQLQSRLSVRWGRSNAAAGIRHGSDSHSQSFIRWARSSTVKENWDNDSTQSLCTTRSYPRCQESQTNYKIRSQLKYVETAEIYWHTSWRHSIRGFRLFLKSASYMTSLFPPSSVYYPLWTYQLTCCRARDTHG